MGLAHHEDELVPRVEVDLHERMDGEEALDREARLTRRGDELGKLWQLAVEAVECLPEGDPAWRLAHFFDEPDEPCGDVDVAPFVQFTEVDAVFAHVDFGDATVGMVVAEHAACKATRDDDEVGRRSVVGTDEPAECNHEFPPK